MPVCSMLCILHKSPISFFGLLHTLALLIAGCCLAAKLLNLNNTNGMGRGDRGVAVGCYGNIKRIPDGTIFAIMLFPLSIATTYYLLELICLSV